MKLFKRIIWALALIALFFAGDRLFAKILARGVDQSQFRYSRMYRGEAEASILLMGNSRGLGFYQPYIEEVTGKKTFNLSYNGMTMDVASALILDYLEQYPNARLLLLDVTLCDRKSIPFVTGFTTYIPYSKRLQQLILETNPTAYYAQHFSHLFRYNNEVHQRTLYYQNRSDEDWLLERNITRAMEEEVENENYQIDLRLVEELKATVDSVEAKGVKVQLLINPYYVPFAEVMKGLDTFKLQIEAVTQHKVHDFSEALPQKEYFGDYQHLNQAGSRAYVNLLKRKGIFD
ncbi:MAG: hypothetical protein AAGG68_08435 [Bacteroidota bacterium]